MVKFLTKILVLTLLVCGISKASFLPTPLAKELGGTGTSCVTAACAANSILPSQTSNAGKFLTTDGTDTSWGTVSVSSAFSAITAGTNTTAAMVVGSGSSIAATGSGTITATSIAGTLPIASGGTNNTTYGSNQVPYFDGTKLNGQADFTQTISGGHTTLTLGGTSQGVLNVTGSNSGPETLATFTAGGSSSGNPIKVRVSDATRNIDIQAESPNKSGVYFRRSAVESSLRFTNTGAISLFPATGTDFNVFTSSGGQLELTSFGVLTNYGGDFSTHGSLSFADPGSVSTVSFLSTTAGITYSLKWPDNTGTPGQVLTTDGASPSSATLSWATPSGGMHTNMDNTVVTTSIPDGTNLYAVSSSGAGFAIGTTSTSTPSPMLIGPGNASLGSNAAGANLYINASSGDGTGIGGDIISSAGAAGVSGAQGGSYILYSAAGAGNDGSSFQLGGGNSSGSLYNLNQGSVHNSTVASHMHFHAADADSTATPADIEFEAGENVTDGVTRGAIKIMGKAAGPVDLRFLEDTDNGVNYVGFKAPASLSGNQIWQLPSADGTSGQSIKTNGSGVLSFGTPVSVGDTIGSATANSIFYAGAAGVLAQDNTHLFYDGSSDAAVTIGSASKQGTLTVTGANAGPTTVASFTGGSSSGANPVKIRVADASRSIDIQLGSPSTNGIFFNGSGGQTAALRFSSGGAVSIFPESSTPADFNVFTSGGSLTVNGTTGLLTNTAALKSATSLIVEDPGAGTNTVTVQAPTLAADRTITLPSAASAAGQFVVATDSSGTLAYGHVNSSGIAAGPNSAYSVPATAKFVYADTLTALRAYTLPVCDTALLGKEITFTNQSSGGNDFTVGAASGETINGVTGPAETISATLWGKYACFAVGRWASLSP